MLKQSIDSISFKVLSFMHGNISTRGMCICECTRSLTLLSESLCVVHGLVRFGLVWFIGV